MSLETREQWDAAARDYQQTFRRGPGEYTRQLLSFWEERGMLRPGIRVLDVGCGVGKYGVEFARRGCDVTLTDISPEMLRLAAVNMEDAESPWRTVSCDFARADPEAEPFSRGFDFSISTMSPAVRDMDSVKKLSAMTRGWCFLSRFAAWEQPLRDEITRRVGLEPRPAFSRMTEQITELREAVKTAGYAPELRLVDYGWADRRTAEEMESYMLRRVLAPEKNTPELRARLWEAVASLTEADGTLLDAVDTKAAWIWWNTEKRGEGIYDP